MAWIVPAIHAEPRSPHPGSYVPSAQNVRQSGTATLRGRGGLSRANLVEKRG